MELEKVIKGLECCTKIDGEDKSEYCGDCDCCPYLTDDNEWVENGYAACRAFAEQAIMVPLQLAYDAIALLKAVEPTIGGDANGPCGNWWYQCSKCKEAIDYHDKYCRNCGQAVKW